ncbi:hypothetical protein C922_03733 [Plasmodium inui San Antonio 1]|uniref:Uncharacterized protein n=1 Tax=Plasmodium inui San Antonio 1 TaxID=1237626 RepID=W7A255_9APIC|nr:hypothetical protein C922_03733 [Plasmodium inui San Antonio 1]EUD65750.1 hypothetical protein C922_03733 [Plasmodium inui San Antonio 1]
MDLPSQENNSKERLIDVVTGASIYDLFEAYGRKHIPSHCNECFRAAREEQAKGITKCKECLTGILGKWEKITWDQWKEETRYKKASDELELWKDLDSWAYLLMSKDQALRRNWGKDMERLWNKVIEGIAKGLDNKRGRRRKLGIPTSRGEALIKLTHGWAHAFKGRTRGEQLPTSEVICNVLNRMGWMPSGGRMQQMCSNLPHKQESDSEGHVSGLYPISEVSPTHHAEGFKEKPCSMHEPHPDDAPGGSPITGLAPKILDYEDTRNEIEKSPGTHEAQGITGEIPWGKVAIGVMASLSIGFNLWKVKEKRVAIAEGERSFLRKRIFRRNNSFKRWTELDEWEDSEISSNDSGNQTDEDSEDRGHSYSIGYGIR